MFLRIERSPLRQHESAADPRQSAPTTDVTDDHEDYDTTSLVLRDYDIDDLSEEVDSKSAATVASSVSSSSDVKSQVSRSSPSKSDENSTPASVAGSQQSTLADATFGSQNVLPASVDQLPVASSSDVLVLSAKSLDSSCSIAASLTVVTSATVSSRTESVQATQTARGKVTTASTSKMAVVPPLAKKGLTHLLNSSSALFHRKRQLQTDSDTKNLSVGYTGTESVLLSDSSISSAETGNESQLTCCQNVDANVVPVVCDDEMFLMVKDDFCLEPTDLSTVDKTEISSSSSLSYKNSCLSSRTSLPSSDVLSVPSSEVQTATDKQDSKDTSDTVSLRSRQVSSVCLCGCCQILRLFHYSPSVL